MSTEERKLRIALVSGRGWDCIVGLVLATAVGLVSQGSLR